jgi:EpsI family protein
LRSGIAVAALILVGSGQGYRLMADRYSRSGTEVVIPRGTLDAVPIEIGEWRGRDVALDDAVVRATDTDDHINREYRSAVDAGTVTLYVACGVHLRDLFPHRPDVCYAGSGWTQVDSQELLLDKDESGEFRCLLQHYSRGVLASQRVSVLYYYIVDGENCADVSLLRSKAWRAGDGVHYSAQVQVVSGVLPPERADRSVKEFAIASAPHIRSVLTDAVNAAKRGVD